MRLPWQIHERGTVYRQLSAQPPHRLLLLKKNLNHFCLDCHSVCDNVYRSLSMFSALAAVCTVHCAIEIVLITLHYILRRKRSRFRHHKTLIISQSMLQAAAFWGTGTPVFLIPLPPTWVILQNLCLQQYIWLSTSQCSTSLLRFTDWECMCYSVSDAMLSDTGYYTCDSSNNNITVNIDVVC